MNILKKAGKIIGGVMLLLMICFVVYLNYGLYYSPRFANIEKDEVNIDLLAHLRFLKVKIHAGAADEMQQHYPEGFIFMHALYGLSWCEFVQDLDKDSDLFKEGHAEIQFTFNEINSEKGKSTFQPNLPLLYGAFYIGWSNYLLGKKIGIEKPQDRNSTEVNLYHANCDRIAAAIDSSASPYPETYVGKAWPADVSAGVASLANHDQVFHQKYSAILHLWISKVKRFLDADGLIPYAFDPVNLKITVNEKGSAQSLVQNFLFEIDSSFCKEQFIIYKKHFLAYRAGLPGILQYRKGTTGETDVDSGPVIFGVGVPASIVGLRVMSLMKENETAIGLRNSIEAFGFTTESNGQKKYLFGKLPIADAFICWANSNETNAATRLTTEKYWRTKFQLYSLLIVLPVLLLFLRLVGFRNPLKNSRKA